MIDKQSSKEWLTKSLTASLIAGFGATGLAACGGYKEAYFDPARSSTVVDKDYDDPDKTTRVIMAGNAPVSVTDYDPAHYNLSLMQCGSEPNLPNTDAKGCMTVDYEVSEKVFESVTVGDNVTPSLLK